MINGHNFTTLKRAKNNKHLSAIQFDLLVFGGGITGAGIALDAVSRGLKVALIEKHDFASGTSSRSTKLIHGGLRYLEKFQFKFVAQLGKERKIIHDNAVNNIIPTPVILPIYKHGELNKPLSFIALKIYDLLAKVKAGYKAQWIKKTLLLKKYPLLNAVGLQGAYKYYEYKTNDGRLVIECLKKASELGALCMNYLSVEELTYLNNKVSGAIICDMLSNDKISVKANYIVNATGAWSEKFLNTFNQAMPKLLYPTKGAHIVVSRSRFQLNEAFYFDTHDKRMVFAIPRNNFVYIGTTDTPYNENFENPLVTSTDINYLIKAVNDKFSTLNLIQDDVISCWAGIRPLIQEKSSNPGEISRKDEIFISDSGLITIVGGKLTGYRLMAKKVVDGILQKYNKPFVKCKTQHIKLAGSTWHEVPKLHQLIEYNDSKFDEAKQLGIQPEDFRILFYRYGTNIDLITEKAYEYHSQFNNAEHVWLKAEIWYSIHFECTTNLIGFLAYRTEKVLFETEKLSNQLLFIADCMAELLHWSAEIKQKQIDTFKKEWNQYQPQITK